VIRTLSRLAGAVAICAAMVAATAGTALADVPPVSVYIWPNAYLQSDGSALVTITYQCFTGFGGPTGSISGTLEQPSGAGAGAAAATCDDQYHTTTVDFQPGPYVRGNAAANVTVGTGINESGSEQAEIRIQ
jgi:hypothetical protein